MSDKRTLKAAMVGLSLSHAGTIGPEQPSFMRQFHHLDGVEVTAFCEWRNTDFLKDAEKHFPDAGRYDNPRRIDREGGLRPRLRLRVPQPGTRDAPEAQRGGQALLRRQAADAVGGRSRPRRQGRQRQRSHDLPGLPVPVLPPCHGAEGADRSGHPGSAARHREPPVLRPGGRRVRQAGRVGALHEGRLRGAGGGADAERGRGHPALHRLPPPGAAALRHGQRGHVGAGDDGPAAGPYMEEPLEEIAILAMEFENGAYGCLHHGYTKPVGHVPQGYDSVFAFRGTEGWAEWTPVGSNRLEVYSVSPAVGGRAREGLPLRVGGDAPGGAAQQTLAWRATQCRPTPRSGMRATTGGSSASSTTSAPASPGC